MKKFLTRFIGCALALGITCSGLVGCKDKDSDWEGTGFKQWGAVESVGGFVATTENYIYYINGIAEPENDNEYGAPIKGTLMVADKKDLSNTAIAIPQMYTATDYGAGVFIDNGYAYYGTSNTEKNSDGNVANRELLFVKAKLDGTSHETLFNAGDLDVEYRIVKSGDTVYIVYYDEDDSAIKSFNTSTKEEIVVAKQDAKSSTNYSLKEYKFVKTEMGSIAVVFTLTAYAEDYIEDKDKEGYQRLTELYNYVYAYSAGDAIDDKGVAGKIVLNGESTRETYTLTNVYGDYVFVSSTNTLGVGKNYGAKTSELLQADSIKTLKNSAYATSTAYIENLESVYVIEDTKIINVSLTGDEKLTKKVVALVGDASKIINVIGNDLYYVTKTTEVARIELNNEKANIELVTGDLIATSWYAPEFITIEGKTYLFYNDSSSFGAGYTKYIDLAEKAIGEDTDGDGEKDKYALPESTFLGQLSQTDRVAIATAKVAVIENSLSFGLLPMEIDEESGLFYNKEVIEARKAYNELLDGDKEKYTEETLKKLEKYEKAIIMANEYNKLSGMLGYANKDINEQTQIRNAYNAVKDTIIEFINSEDYNEVSAMIENNVKWYFTAAYKEFEK